MIKNLAVFFVFFILASRSPAQVNAASSSAKVAADDTLLVPIIHFVNDASAFETEEVYESQYPSDLPKAQIDSSLLYTDTTIKWMTIEEGIARQQKTNAKLLIYVYASWCRWCKALDTVFANKEIAHYLNQQFIPVKFNAETKTAVITEERYISFCPIWMILYMS